MVEHISSSIASNGNGEEGHVSQSASQSAIAVMPPPAKLLTLAMYTPFLFFLGQLGLLPTHFVAVFLFSVIDLCWLSVSVVLFSVRVP